jgi:hypothetical protein
LLRESRAIHSAALSYRRLAAVSLLAALALEARMAAGQRAIITPPRSYRPFVSLHLDGGGARNFERGRWGLLGAAAAGVGLYDGDRIWDFTAGVRGVRGDQRAVTLEAARATVESGFGYRATVIWDLDRRAAGVGAGLGLSLLKLEGDIVFDGKPTVYALLFVSVPVGFLAHIAFGGRR